MYEDLKYEDVPYGHPHCFMKQCKLKKQCSHYIAGKLCDDSYHTITLVNPKRVPEDTTTCQFYNKLEKVELAWGIRQFLAKIPYAKALAVKKLLKAHFTKTGYDRLMAMKHAFGPEDQKKFRAILRSQGVDLKPEYDHVTPKYIFSSTKFYK